MLGLPTETDEDAVAIVDLAKSVLRAGRQSGYRAQVTASVGVFVPRPHTPFQREGMAPPETIARRQGLIRDAAKRSGVQVKLAEGRDSRLECALARGNRSLSAVILRAFRAGCRFDNWSERARREVWADAFAAEGIDTDALSRPIPPDATLPWEVVDPLVSRAFLERERERAYSARPLVPCEKPAPRGGVRPGPAEVASARRVVCYACGAGCEPHEVASERAAIVAGGEALAAPRPAAPAGPPRVPVLWHLRYTKTGRAAWLSQKDMVKHLPRVLRRAGLRLDVSHGFHPMPRLSYRPPLPVGYRSVGEWADAVVLLAEGESVSLDALNAASVDGIVFASAERKAKRTRPGDTWRLAFASPVPLTEAVARLAPLPVSALDDDDATGLLAGSDLCVLDWTVTAHPPGRPHEVLSAAFGVPFTPWDLVRLRETPVPEVEVAHDPDPAPCVPLDDDPGAGDDGLLGE
jgi:hypothetical protein